MESSDKKTRREPGRLRPSIDLLRFFVDLGDNLAAAAAQGANYKSLRELAGKMPYAASYLFRCLEELRKVYGQPLVNQDNVMLTPAGEAILAWAKELLALHARGRQWPIGGRERVVIGTSNLILSLVLPEIVRDFLKERPRRKGKDPDLSDLDLTFLESDVEQVILALQQGKIHAAIRGLPLTGRLPGLSIETLQEEIATIMIASPAHERWGHDTRNRRTDVTMKELATETVCLVAADQYELLAGLPRPKRGGSRIVVENYSSLVALVRAGAAVGFLPQLHHRSAMTTPAYEGLTVYGLEDEIPLRTLAILSRSKEDLPEAAKRFLDFVKQKLKS
jgi:DNA-binding transcriptional LysR family regulator